MSGKQQSKKINEKWSHLQFQFWHVKSLDIITAQSNLNNSSLIRGRTEVTEQSAALRTEETGGDKEQQLKSVYQLLPVICKNNLNSNWGLA